MRDGRGAMPQPADIGYCSIRIFRYYPGERLLIVRYRGEHSAEEWLHLWRLAVAKLEGLPVERALVDWRGCDSPGRETAQELARISTRRGSSAREAFLVDTDDLDVIDAAMVYREARGAVDGNFIISESLADASAFLDIELDPVLEGLAQLETWRTL